MGGGGGSGSGGENLRVVVEMGVGNLVVVSLVVVMVVVEMLGRWRWWKWVEILMSGNIPVHCKQIIQAETNTRKYADVGDNRQRRIAEEEIVKAHN